MANQGTKGGTMKRMMMILGLCVLTMRVIQPIGAQDKKEERQAPYFFVKNNEGQEQFPLMDTDVNVNIAGVIAYGEVTQVYKNEGDKTIEAVYAFPLSTHAAVNRMQMKIADRVLEANIEKKETARDIYETAKNAGQAASLLEQQRPNVFQMNVANIMPGDVVRVTVHYTELLIPEDGVYEYVFPAVVGPRYSGEDTGKNNSWLQIPYLRAGNEVTSDVDITVTLNTPFAVEDVWVPSHNVTVEKGNLYARVEVDEKNAGNRDFILRYNLRGGKIQTGLMLYPGDENFFLLTVQPPENVQKRDVPPREYVFVVDVSGSMNGFPLEVSKTLIRNVLDDLNETDYFNIVFFAGGSNVLSPRPLEATQENIRNAVNMLESQRGSGGTNLLSALNGALALPKPEGISRTVVIATDGYISVERRAFDMIRNRIGNANCFTFGIGTSTNRYLIEGLARAGDGEPFVAGNKKEAKKIAKNFLTYVSRPVLTDVKVEYRGFDAYDTEPKAIGDLFAERPLIIYGKYKNARGKIIVTGNTASGPYRKVIDVSQYTENSANTALRYIWAREKIARLSDYGSVGVDVKDQVTELGLTYSLMTEYTSFVAVDTVVRDTGEIVRVKQPLPLPQGVSELALGESGVYPRACLKASAGFDRMAQDMAAAPEVEKVIPRVTVVEGVFPQSMTLQQFDALLEPVKEKLADLFKAWSLQKVTLEITADAPGALRLNVAGFTGRECHKADLTRIFKSLNLPRGYMRIILKYQ